MPQPPDAAPEGSQPPPAAPRNLWANLDADFRDDRPPPPEAPTQLPTVGFSGRFFKVAPEPPADPRVRWEFAALVAWVLISCLWQGFVPWVILGCAWSLYALGTRRAFRQYHQGAQPWIYCAMGVGQILLSFSFIANLGPFWPFIGLYWLVVLVAWLVAELRSHFGKRSGPLY